MHMFYAVRLHSIIVLLYKIKRAKESKFKIKKVKDPHCLEWTNRSDSND